RNPVRMCRRHDAEICDEFVQERPPMAMWATLRGRKSRPTASPLLVLACRSTTGAHGVHTADGTAVAGIGTRREGRLAALCARQAQVWPSVLASHDGGHVVVT